MHTSVALALAGLAAVVVINVLARRAALPAAVLLVLAGLGYAFMPGPNLALSPDLVLDVLIPPLLYAAAINSSAVALRRNGRAVISLSVGLVIATALVIGVVLHAIVPQVPLAAAIALGAAVAPPDPVAALAIGRPAGMPPRLTTLIEGEGLLNDATALTLLGVASAAVSGSGFAAPQAFGRFLLAAAGGAVSGLVVAWVLARIRRWTREPLAENAISIGTPYAAYLLAQSFHGSGVLAAVVAGLWIAHHGPELQSGASRLQTRAVWSLIEYILEGFVFLLIGQQLPSVLDGLKRYDAGTVAAAGLATVGLVIAIRPLWLTASEVLPGRLHTRLGRTRDGRHAHLSGREVVALSWAGTRGVITLAAAASLPLTVGDGERLPGRDLLQFCAYLVVLVTLVGQGVSFAPLLHRLGFRDRTYADALLRNQARLAAAKAALERLEELLEQDRVSETVAGPLRRAAHGRLERFERRTDRLSSVEETRLPADDPYYVATRIRRAMIEAERGELLQWRDTGRLPDRSLRILQRELDYEEGQLPPHPQ